MKVIAFAASPRKNGNTEILLDEIVKGLQDGCIDVEKIRTHELDIYPCNGCGQCDLLGRCVIQDPFQDLFDSLVECDGVVFASPLYFMNVPARGKVLIDRCQSFWAAKYRLKLDLFDGRKRLGMLVSCSGRKYGLGKAFIFRGIEDTITYFFKVLGMKKMDSLLFSNVDSKGAVLNHSPLLEKARNAGKLMAELLLKK